jgi:hypothetical protein
MQNGLSIGRLVCWNGVQGTVLKEGIVRFVYRSRCAATAASGETGIDGLGNIIGGSSV